MTNIELALNTLAEAATTELSKQQEPSSFAENKNVAKSGGSVVKAAREELEGKLGHTVISSLNAKLISEEAEEKAQIEQENI